MEQLRVLIADDEPGMRLILKTMIERAEGCALVAEAEDGAAVPELAEKHKPHVVFLDVEMPGMSGVECARVIQDTDPATIIVFATAHDDYMSDAFELYAFDYMVKPFKMERVLQTLARARELRLGTAEADASEAPPLKTTGSAVSAERMMLKHRDGVSILNLSDILLVQREDRATVLYTANDGRYVTGDALGDVEKRLPAHTFFRCHKSYIINLGQIRDITPYGRWTYVVRLNGTKHDALITHETFEELEHMFR